MSDLEAISKIILNQLPGDGTPVSNRIMRILLSRQMGKIVNSDNYFSARDILFDRGQIGRQRGRGGQIFRVAVATDRGQSEDSSEDVAEAALMAPLENFLRTSFLPNLDLPPISASWIKNTSQPQGRKGIWLNPDFVLVSAARFRLVPDLQLDVHAFELKPVSKGSLQAVAQAVAQTRFAHYGHLVWHLPPNNRFESRIEEIESYCEHQGIGLILIRDPGTPEGFEVRVDPERKLTPAAAIDAFLEQRLNEKEQQQLADFIHGATS